MARHPLTGGDAAPDREVADRLSFLISAVASPFLVLFAFLILLSLHLAPDRRTALLWSTVAVLGMVAAPALYVLAGVARGQITDVHVQLREQRSGAFVAALAGCALAAVLLGLVGAAPAMVLAAVAAFINGLVFMAITLRWKIAMHTAMVTACALLAGWFIGPRWYWALAVLPVVVWARIHRERHTLAQALAGAGVAAAVTVACVLISQGWLVEVRQ